MELRALMTGCSARQALSAELDAAVVISPVECFNAPLPGSPATTPKCARLYEQAGCFTLKCLPDVVYLLGTEGRLVGQHMS
jgi:hypothetical protein